MAFASPHRTPPGSATKPPRPAEALQHRSSDAAPSPEPSTSSTAPPAPATGQRHLTSAGSAAEYNAQFVYELQRKWRTPRSGWGRMVMFLKAMLFRIDYIMGGYIFDWWETALVYSFYLLLLLLATRQLWRGWELLCAAAARGWDQLMRAEQQS